MKSNGTNASNVHFGTDASFEGNNQTPRVSHYFTTYVHGECQPNTKARASDCTLESTTETPIQTVVS